MAPYSACPLCGKDADMGPRAELLYGEFVCRKCCRAFGNRRGIAFLIDLIFLNIVAFAVRLGIEAVAGPIDLSGLGWLVLAFPLKDGFGGYSPGKALMGIRVVHGTSGHPSGFRTSFARNLPLLVPFVALVVAFQIKRGRRVGDGWAKTRVVWTKHSEKPPFLISREADRLPILNETEVRRSVHPGALRPAQGRGQQRGDSTTSALESASPVQLSSKSGSSRRTSGTRIVAREWLYFLAGMSVGLLFVPLAVFLISGERESVPTFYSGFFEALLGFRGVAWLVTLSPYLLFQLMRSVIWAIRMVKATE